MASGSPLPPAPLLPARGKRIHPLRWPLIILTFPFSLAVFLLQSLLGWLPTARLVTRRRILKLGAIFGVFWLVFGQLTMWFDDSSAMWGGNVPELSAGTQYRLHTETAYSRSWLASGCSQRIQGDTEGGPGGWPFGRPFSFALDCSGELGGTMIGAVGLDGLARGWQLLVIDARDDWLTYGRTSWPYFVVGAGIYLQFLLAIPWLIGVALYNVVTRLRWE